MADQPYWKLYNNLTKTQIKIDKSPFHAGRGANHDIICTSNKVSRNHAVFITKPDHTLYVQDCKSSNGIFVNRKQIDSEVPFQLHNNDEVGLGVHSEMKAAVIDPDIDYKFVYIVQQCTSPVVISDDEEEISTKHKQINGIDIDNTKASNNNTCTSIKHKNQAKCFTSQQLYKMLAFDGSESSSEVETNKTNNLQEQNNEMASNNLPKNQVPDDTTHSFNRSCNKTDEEKIKTVKPDDKNKEEINRDLAGNEIICNSKTNTIEREHPYKTVTSDTLGIVRNLAKLNPILPNSKQNSNKCNTIEKTDNIVPDNNNTKSYTSASDNVASDGRKSLNMQVVNIDKSNVDQTPAENDSNDEIFIKKEIKQEFNSVDISYTAEDGVIVIDDDQDIPLSQFFDDPIKQELAAFDSPSKDGVPYMTVNLVHDSDLDDDDWLMESVSANDANENAQGPILEMHSPEYETSVTDDRITGKKSDDTTTKNEEQMEDSSVEKTETFLQQQHSPRKTGAKTYTRPPIISPHIEVKYQKKAKLPSPENRKTDTKDDKKSGKTKRSKKNAKVYCDSKQTELFKKRQKEKIHETQKRKLKEIAEKHVGQKKRKTSEPKTAAIKVKVSDMRGKYLAEEVKPSTSKGASPYKTPKTTRSDERRATTSKSSGSRSTTSIPYGNSIPLAPQSVIPRCPTDHFVVVPSSISCTATVAPKHDVSNDFSPHCHGIEDIILPMLSWKTMWFCYFNETKALPPIFQERLQRMLQNFNTCEEYYEIVKPFLELELFNNIYSGINTVADPRKRKHMAQIDDEIRKPTHIELNCSTYIDREEIDNGYHLKVEDVVMVQFALKQNNQMITVPLLGYVINVSKRVIQGSEFIDVNFAKNIGVKPHGKLSFTVMVERYIGVAVKEKYMYFGNAASLTPFKRIIKSVKYLENSPLCQHILKPATNLYQVQKVQPQRIHAQERLNTNQCYAVLEAAYMCLRKEPSIYLIQGPPGTGKSTVVIGIIQQILFSESRNSKPPCILIAAPSNAAVDEIALRLIKLRSTLDEEKRKKIKLVRIGPKHMIHPDVQDYCIYDLVRKNIYREILRDQRLIHAHDHLRVLFDNIQSLKKNCTSQEAKHKLNAAKRTMDTAIKNLLNRQYYSTSKKTEETLLSNAGIICTTLSSCAGSKMWDLFHKGLNKNKISCCIVDEATKSSEQETLIPLSLNIDKLVLVGDPKQLPGVTLSKDAKDLAHGQSLFSRIMSHFEGRSYNPIRMLNVQYRMHPEICKFPNKTYYGGKLKNATILERRNSKLEILKPYMVFNLKTNFNNSQEYSNKTEVACITKLLDAIEMNFSSSDTYSVGIITPYNDQKERIKAELKEKRFRCNVDVTVNTVDSFQGQEKDIIILSFVREFSNQFVGDEQRLNVALTRAMHALYIIGSENLYDSSNALEKIYKDAKHRSSLKIISYQIATKTLSQLIKR